MRPFRSLLHAVATTAFALATTVAAHAYAKLGSSWPSGSIPMALQLDATANAASFPLTDGTTSWNNLAIAAMTTWNANLARSRFTWSTSNASAAANKADDRINQVFFATNYYGTAFDSRTLAVTLVDNGDLTIRSYEADLIVNKSVVWNSYRGNIATTPLDLQRVLLHELGHVLGLDHPDQAKPTQNVSAIMNSTISNLDSLTSDDLAGVAYLYNTPFSRPVITQQPISQTTTAGGAATLAVAVNGQDPPVGDDFHSYAWYFKATGATAFESLFTLVNPGSLSFKAAQTDDAGSYEFQAITPDDLVVSGTATLTVNTVTTVSTTQLTNLSTRGIGGTSANKMIVGFVVTGSRSKSVLIRAAGPALASFHVDGILTDPQLVVRDSSGATVATSAAIWDQSPNIADIRAAIGRVGAFAFAPGSRDSAVLVSLAAGSYTATANSPTNATGTVLIEAYDADPTRDPTSRISNLSTRGFVTTGTDTLIAGFTVAGPGPRNYLIRVVGDTLRTLGVTNTLDDPFLSLYTGSALIREKDDWDSPATSQTALRAAFAQVGAFTLGDRQEPAMLVTLPPRSYSAKATGLTNGGATIPTGNALIEIYEMP
jgi:hypothetical protein